jgi:hypothetical protein
MEPVKPADEQRPTVHDTGAASLNTDTGNALELNPVTRFRGPSPSSALSTSAGNDAIDELRADAMTAPEARPVTKAANQGRGGWQAGYNRSVIATLRATAYHYKMMRRQAMVQPDAQPEQALMQNSSSAIAMIHRAS